MTRRSMALALGGLLLVAAGLGAWAWQQRADDGVEAPPGGEIALPSTRGEFSLAGLEDDELAVLYFGYTYCPDICPMSLSVVRQALQRLAPDEAARVVPVLITVDPERDTLARLEEYVGFFGDAFIGARGSEAQLADVAERYGIVWRKGEADAATGDYTVDHSSSLLVVDGDGEILRRVLYSSTPQALTAALEAELSRS